MNRRFKALMAGALALVAGLALWTVIQAHRDARPPEAGGVWRSPVVRTAALQGGLVLVLVAGAWRLTRELRARETARRMELDEKTRALREAAAAHQAIIDNSDALICTLDAEGRYLSMNRFGLSFLDADLEDISGKYVEEHLDDKGAARLREYLGEVRRTGELARVREPLRINGRERYVDLYLKVFDDPGPASPFALMIVRDVTGRKALDDRMWQAERLASLGLLAAGVAHEINNPLGVTMGFCELLLEGSAEDSDERRNLSIIYNHCQQCKKIVEGLLRFTRLSDADAGHADPLAALRIVVDAVRGVLARKGIDLVLDLPDRLPPCPAGGGVMQQVFLNLIGNAMDAMAAGGRLGISARVVTKPPYQGDVHGTLPPGGRYVEFEVSDTGPGIAPEHMGRIFDPFFTTKPVDKGTGLGLSVVYGLVREYEGTITCRSPVVREGVEGGGACFTVRLPVGAGD